MTPHVADTPVLETERLTLRAPAPQDWPAFAAFYATDRAQFVGGPVDARKAWRAFGHVIGHWVLRGFGSFIVARRGSDAAIGLVGPWFPEGWPEREIGWTLWDTALQGTGIAHEAAAAARAHAFRELGWQTAVSYVDPANARSIALATRLGAVRDTAAPTPDGDDTLVFRHPGPGGM